MKKVLIFLLVFISNNLLADLIKVAIKNPPTNINPIYNPNNDVVKLLYSGLFYKNNNQELVPVLITSYKVSNDKLKYEFKLQKGLYFIKNNVNYGEFSAEDVKITYDTIKNKLYNSSYEQFYNNILDIDIIDKYTIEFVLKSPDNDFLNNLTLGIMSKNALIKYGLSWFNTDAIGLGTYHLKQYSNEQIVLIKNQNAILKPNNDGVVLKIYQNDVQIKNALNNNIVDVGLINYKNLKNIDEDIEYKVLKSTHSIALNLNNKIIYNRKLRYAISLAICSKQISNQFPNLIISKYANNCNKEEARKLLNELGYFKERKSIDLNINKENNVNYFKKLDIPLKLEIFVDNKEYFNIAENIATQLKDFGILTTILPSSNDEYEASKIIDIEYNHNINFIKILNSNKKDKTQTKTTINEFQENYYKEFQEQIKFNQPYIFLVDYNYYLAYSKNVFGIDDMLVGFNGSGLLSQVINWYKYE
ncbi:nickel/dipeptide/oligopeptide ABC transporter, periplasmic substrate-binding protein [Campylobacter sp. RM5004]|uniref:ABC transporter substrate-binding protein n=1 Tax=Campylobacter sp. RM5004 TaxID=1660078 RepID=UPI001EFBD1DF|nr:ABC transporter substrate-binding protein [Campylobacter sp. RM5004]ULO01382.1 nickel/dipeptide/oligopeptide ABC transporter, periplasmic substrate-binding protein [Campylobacter sp. RM5004]